MPPGPAFNWFCVAHSVADILYHAAHIRATQLSGVIAKVSTDYQAADTRGPLVPRPVPPVSFVTNQGNRAEKDIGAATNLSTDTSSARFTDAVAVESPQSTPLSRPAPLRVEPMSSPASFQNDVPDAETQLLASPAAHERREKPPSVTTDTAFTDPSLMAGAVEPVVNSSSPSPSTRTLQSSKVPSSRIGRFFHYGGLAASLGYGAASELLRRTTSSSEDQPASLMLTEGNIKRLVAKLTQLRGAALKLGQFMSIQDSHVLPPELEDIFRRVQDSAHYMPDWQMEDVLRSSLGPSWSDRFESFDRLPFAAASIGQVHSAVLAASSSPTGRPEKVAVKIQFPNIANSIETDLGYVKVLLTAGRLLPRGLFLDRTIQVMKSELADECDYTREASFLRKFASPSYLGSDPCFKIPWVWDGSTEHVLVMEHVNGVSVGGSMIDSLSQQDRNDIAAHIIDLCLRELFVFRTMQTDPNWTNFLWNSQTRQIELVDFGATREYSKGFIDNWLHLLQAAASDDREACIEWSLKLGYLTGEENEIMMDAHVRSMILLATPFRSVTPQPFSFGPGSQWAAITTEIRDQIPVMLKHRLTPPPRETYSLNRKLSGAFLLAARLRAAVDCNQLWENVVQSFQFGDEDKA